MAQIAEADGFREALNSYELRGLGPVTENNPSQKDFGPELNKFYLRLEKLGEVYHVHLFGETHNLLSTMLVPPSMSLRGVFEEWETFSRIVDPVNSDLMKRKVEELLRIMGDDSKKDSSGNLPSWLTKRMAVRLQKAAAKSFDEFMCIGFFDNNFKVTRSSSAHGYISTYFYVEGKGRAPQEAIIQSISRMISEEGDEFFRFANALLDSTEAEDVDTMSKFKNDVLDMFTIPMIQEVFTNPMWMLDSHGSVLTYINGGVEVYGTRLDLSSPSVLANFSSALGRHFEMATKKDGSGAFVSELISNHMKHRGH